MYSYHSIDQIYTNLGLASALLQGCHQYSRTFYKVVTYDFVRPLSEHVFGSIISETL